MHPMGVQSNTLALNVSKMLLSLVWVSCDSNMHVVCKWPVEPDLIKIHIEGNVLGN